MIHKRDIAATNIPYGEIIDRLKGRPDEDVRRREIKARTDRAYYGLVLACAERQSTDIPRRPPQH